MSFRARHADVEQSPLLGDLYFRPRELDRQLPLLDAWDEDGHELESFRAVQRQEVNAAPFVSRRAEPALELVDEVAHRLRSVVELARKRDETAKVELADQLALAQLLGWMLEPTRFLRLSSNGRSDCSEVAALAQFP